MLNGLHKALDRGDLQLVYQPCVDASSGAMTAVEALARWTFEGTAVPPSEFIALAEQGGLIDRIGEWASDGRDVHAYFNNDGHGHAVRNAQTLRALIPS